jgi:NDP-sugar pyrophosphorylase family protein
MQISLVVLAAGMGSRYGGLKQIDPIGPGGETMLDYSIFDALRGGVNRVVFVIRKSIEAEFRQAIGSRFEKRLDVAYAFQELDQVPAGFDVPAHRTKPWGTGHAIRAARPAVSGPFIAINADDFYGADAYRQLVHFLTRPAQPERSSYAMAGFRLRNTLSKHGHVSRGICMVDGDQRLVNVVERTRIMLRDQDIVFENHDGNTHALTGDEWVSMNMWAFQPDVFDHLETRFERFLAAHGQEEKSEFYLPAMVDELIREKQATVDVLPVDSQWFGVTYREDKPAVEAAIRELIQQGFYPERL